MKVDSVIMKTTLAAKKKEEKGTNNREEGERKTNLTGIKNKIAVVEQELKEWQELRRKEQEENQKKEEKQRQGTMTRKTMPIQVDESEQLVAK